MKKRALYFAATILVMILGLASRKFMHVFPIMIAPYVGDTLWAAMVYFGFRFLLPSFNPSISLILAFLFSFFIEFSQLYQADWINQIRATTLGGLILGYGFLVEDLISYSIGITAAFGIDYMLNLKLNKQKGVISE